MSNLVVMSGDCTMCDSGVPVSAKDADGHDLHTGDIVMIWHGEYLGTDIETWTPVERLTAVISDQYESFSDGSVIEKDGNPEFFVMGIKGSGFDSPEWKICIVKKYSDVVPGEKWPAFGFSYRAKEHSQ